MEHLIQHEFGHKTTAERVLAACNTEKLEASGTGENKVDALKTALEALSQEIKAKRESIRRRIEQVQNQFHIDAGTGPQLIYDSAADRWIGVIDNAGNKHYF